MAGIYDDFDSKSKFQIKGQEFTEELQQEKFHRQHQNEQQGKFLIRDYQIDAVLETKKYFDDTSDSNPCKPALISAPTGSGKLGMVAMLPYVLEGKQVVIICPTTYRSNQIAESFGYFREIPSFFEQTSTVNRPKTSYAHFLEIVTLIKSSQQILKERMSNLVIVPVQKLEIKSIASLFHQEKRIVEDAKLFFEQFDTLIVDEAHLYPASTWESIVNLFTKPHKKIVFVTASPFAMDGQDILKNQKVTFTVTRRQIEGSAIRKTKFQEIPTTYCHVPDNFPKNAMFCSTLYSLIRDSLQEHNKEEETVRHQSMILVRLARDAIDLADSLNRCAENESFACAIVGDKNNEGNKRHFRDGNYNAAVVCKTYLQGFTNSNVSTCVIIRNVRSRYAFNQFAGLCIEMSTFPDKHSDKVIAHVMSFQTFKNSILWNNRDLLAEEDPVDEQE